MFLFFWTGGKEEREMENFDGGNPNERRPRGGKVWRRKQNLEYESRKVNFFGENRYARSKRQVNSIRNRDSRIVVGDSISKESPFVRSSARKCIIHREIWENRGRNKKSSNLIFHKNSTSRRIKRDEWINCFKIPSLKKAGAHLARRNWFNSRLKPKIYSLLRVHPSCCNLFRLKGRVKKHSAQARGDGYRLMSDRPFRLMQCKSGYFAGKSFDAIPP